MHSFFRAVRQALRYRFTILGILTCSLAVGFLWGANLGTVYPFIKAVVHKQSLHEWLDERIRGQNDRIRAIQERLEREVTSLASAEDVADRHDIQSRISKGKRALAFQRSLNKLHVSAQKYSPQSAKQTLYLVVCVLLIGTIVKVLFLMANMILVERLAQRTAFDIRKLFYRRTLRMSLGDFGRDRTSHYLSHFTHDMQALTSGISGLFGKSIREPLKMLACLVGAALVSWQLLLWSLVVSPIAIVIMYRLSKSLRRANRRAMGEMSQLYGHLAESLNGVQTVKAFTMERHERWKFHQRAKQYMHRATRIMFYNALAKPCTEIIGVGVICIAILAGGQLVMGDSSGAWGIPPLSPEALMTFFALLAGVSDPARKLADIYNQLQRGVAASDRVYSMLDRESSIREVAQPTPLPTPHRELIFNHVDFRYQEDQPILHDVTLRIPNGMSLAVVGPNGCGKSTLVNLIPRFYDPVGGSVQIDGIDLRHTKLSDLRKKIGIVSQSTWLFDDSILNNIRYGSPQATDDGVVEAACRARAHTFIQRMASGYETNVGQEGKLLSGGQRQRIALARAVLRDPEILILDEATSQIDLESEQLIHQALVSFIRGRTAIMITHRLSTLALADQILVMDRGRILDLGSHDELLGRCPFYARLQHLEYRDSA